MADERIVRLKAPAKINLGLVVGLTRPDGFHDLTTVFVRINLFDEVELRTADCELRTGKSLPSDCRLQITDCRMQNARADLPTGKDNLCVQAALLFQRTTEICQPVDIRLTKRIPLGAGLGGGSSDAAAVLKGMNRLFGKPLGSHQMHALALELGSDVPFFLRRSACVATGRGDVLKPVRLPKLHILLHVPGFPVSTPWAYGELDRLRRQRPRLVAGLTQQAFCLNIAIARLWPGRFGSLADLLHNSFEEPVFRRHPGLRTVKARFLKAGADAALLSGSGSGLFALVRPSRVRQVQHALALRGVSFLSLETMA
jgi:4-diphosphocytidyl-2-C-methyl-D-erythritol kinase